ncbi:MAG: hypothetical protein VYB48_13715 [Pseudomonadota bacterium]|nr:hypothetical protein [Pseudomonadota bacterium]
MLEEDYSRKHVEESTDQQRNNMIHDQWLTEQVNAAFRKLERGQAEFVSHDEARLEMEARKNRIRDKGRC